MRSLGILLATVAFVVSSQAALADQWVAAKLRGAVMLLVDGEWQKLSRGAAVEDGQVVRTMASGHVQLVRGKETLDLSPDTQVVIFDRPGSRPFTTVRQYFGTVAVEAEARNVKHFAVITPYLAAVVKGTKFKVVSGKTGASVSVTRGSVAVDVASDSKAPVVIQPGQTASANPTGHVVVTGAGSGGGFGRPGVRSGDTDDEDDEDNGSGRNSGRGNLGDNSGNGNAGGNNGNSGGDNSGNGNGNSGNGNGNSGDGNSGSGNGNGNSGNGNSGNGNSGNGNANGQARNEDD